jgi:two-component system, OmpR family, alkaline phosphatase synthesis response regulator PhoP
MGNVLVVDDNSDLCRILATLLKRAGHQGACATSAAEAMEHLQKHPAPDLMILDLMMPYEDGLSLLEKVRHDPKTRDVPVVVYSAVSEKRYIDKALATGADDYWVKGTFTAEDWQVRLQPFLPDSVEGWAEPAHRHERMN